ncbi:response regulator transcription factor [Candidatus Viridilinea mediisalina]|uniref:DNA-binding response regulator n=1 Tax=Candidatus Viridilinea mediisalina TaxID=2024553 RepID=A0A2A6RNH9_9CHLR|nr:response regulator transcription factor [Candidatus Viridilinea mediisalina]PDW04476.1 DNA-binding response regulator [Candidatus Viridilinea mediisalina]
MQATAHILVVDDEASIRTIARAYLEQAGFQVTCVEHGAEALRLALSDPPDLILLDLNLPGMDGTEVTARIREHSDVFIMMLTARSDESDRVAGLRLGADDYLTKPFSPRELVARVEAILRRRRGAPQRDAALRFRSVTLDPEARTASANGQALELSPTEFDLLHAFVRHPNRALSREQLIELVWGSDFYGTDRVVDVYVGQVRRKLEAATGSILIATVRGVGYRFTDERLP